MRLILGVLILLILVLFWYRESFTTTPEAALPPLKGNDLPGLPFAVRIFQAKNPGPSVLMVGGVHGNEPAGAHAMIEMCRRLDSGELKLKRGKLIIVPMANVWGLSHYQRSNGNYFNTDVNRNFTEEGPADKISEALEQLIRQVDLVLDFHEGWGFHRLQPQSIGSTLSSSSQSNIQQLAQAAVERLNSQIPDPGKHFTHRINEACDIDTTLGCRSQRLGKGYILMETTGQNEIQPRQVRVKQVLEACKFILTACEILA